MIYPIECNYYTGQISRFDYACPYPDALPGDACYETLERVREFDDIYILWY